MSEILRAIMEQTCVDSQMAFYTGSITLTVTNAGGITLHHFYKNIQCKTDTWFLMEGWSFDSGFGSAVVGTNSYAGPQNLFSFAVGSPKTGKFFSINNTPVRSTPDIPQMNMNYNLNNFYTLDEYILFEPSDLIQLVFDVPTTTGGGQFPAGTVTWTSWITLTGIEYKMPAGKGFSGGRG